MPRTVSAAERMQAIRLMKERNEDGSFVYTQRDIEGETGLSRPYIRKLAKQIGHGFLRNGIEIKKSLCVCCNCGTFFRKSPSRIKRAQNQFCDEQCRMDWFKGEKHQNWKGGESINTFSKWVVGQADYKRWKEQALGIANYQCQITGVTENLDVHHIKDKANHQDLALDPKNAIVVCKEVHNKIHSLIRQGVGFEEAINEVKQKYQEEGMAWIMQTSDIQDMASNERKV